MRLQDSLNLLVANFSSVHRGISYFDVTGILPKEGIAFHGGIEAERQLCQVPGTDLWKNTLFWLPTLPDLLVNSHKDRVVFGLH